MSLVQSLSRLVLSDLHVLYGSAARSFSSSTICDRSRDIDEGTSVLAEDGTIVCWHPEKPFPYECSKPLPAAAPIPVLEQPYTSQLNVLAAGKEPLRLLHARKSEKLRRQEMMELTGTNKHIWFPNKQIRYRKKNPPRDRPYL